MPTDIAWCTTKVSTVDFTAMATDKHVLNRN